MPTLVLQGGDDRLVAPERGRELARLIPDARRVLIPHAAHLLTTDAEQRVAGELLAHMARAPAEPAAAAASAS